jgi:hypothetical protein
MSEDLGFVADEDLGFVEEEPSLWERAKAVPGMVKDAIIPEKPEDPMDPIESTGYGLARGMSAGALPKAEALARVASPYQGGKQRTLEKMGQSAEKQIKQKTEALVKLGYDEQKAAQKAKALPLAPPPDIGRPYDSYKEAYEDVIEKYDKAFASNPAHNILGNVAGSLVTAKAIKSPIDMGTKMVSAKISQKFPRLAEFASRAYGKLPSSVQEAVNLMPTASAEGALYSSPGEELEGAAIGAGATIASIPLQAVLRGFFKQTSKAGRAVYKKMFGLTGVSDEVLEDVRRNQNILMKEYPETLKDMAVGVSENIDELKKATSRKSTEAYKSLRGKGNMSYGDSIQPIQQAIDVLSNPEQEVAIDQVAKMIKKLELMKLGLRKISDKQNGKLTLVQAKSIQKRLNAVIRKSVQQGDADSFVQKIVEDARNNVEKNIKAVASTDIETVIHNRIMARNRELVNIQKKLKPYLRSGTIEGRQDAVFKALKELASKSESETAFQKDVLKLIDKFKNTNLEERIRDISAHMELYPVRNAEGIQRLQAAVWRGTKLGAGAGAVGGAATAAMTGSAQMSFGSAGGLTLLGIGGSLAEEYLKSPAARSLVRGDIAYYTLKQGAKKTAKKVNDVLLANPQAFGPNYSMLLKTKPLAHYMLYLKDADYRNMVNSTDVPEESEQTPYNHIRKLAEESITE